MLEIHTKKFKRFAYTMRKVKNPQLVTETTYVNQLNYFRSNLQCIVDEVVFENTSGLHVHGIIRIPVDVSLTRFRVRGWSIKLEEIYDVKGWTKYIHKDQEDSEIDITDTPEDERFIIPKIKLFGNI